MQLQLLLVLRQVFDPLLAWARETLGTELAVDDSIFGANQPSEAIQTLRQHLEGVTHYFQDPAMCCCSSSVTLGQPYTAFMLHKQADRSRKVNLLANALVFSCMCWPHARSHVVPQGPRQSCSSFACATGMDAWHLTAAEYLASSCRSVLLALAVLHVRNPPAPAFRSDVPATYVSWLSVQCFAAKFVR